MHAVQKNRYVVTDGDGDETYNTQVHDQHYDRDSMLGPNFSEAESGIIAFALNAVASGRTLLSVGPAVPLVSTPGVLDSHDSVAYDGPTEGVRS